MADEPTDVPAEITPEDFEGQAPKAESSPAEVKEAKAPEAEKPEAVVKGEAEPEAKETEEAAQADSVETEKPLEGDKVTKADERKTQLNTEIRDLVSQRNALKAEVEKANAEVYQPATEDELTEQGMAAHDAKLEALRQRIEVKDYNDRVADAQLTLSSESERVLQDFPIFNPDSESYDKELAEEAAGLLEANLILDPNTLQVIGSNVSPYQLYKTLARASGLSTVKGQMKGQQDAEQMLANADTGSSAAPAKKPVDPLTALWESEL